jgi:membrane-associated progesterone receptor component
LIPATADIAALLALCPHLPAGIYPFAGHEVARAFALTSTELSDCTDNLEGLGAMELDNLKEWEAKFNWKYPVVGRLIQDA